MKLFKVYLLRVSNGNIKIGQTSLPMSVRLAAIEFYAKASKCAYNKGHHEVLATVSFIGTSKQARALEAGTQVLMQQHKSIVDIEQSNDYLRIVKKVTDTTLIKWFLNTVEQEAKHYNIKLAD